MQIRNRVGLVIISFLLFFQFSSVILAVSAKVSSTSSGQVVPAGVVTYDQLVHAIREVRTESRKRVEQAVRQEKVREAWETGKLIDEHILLHKERAEYGKHVLLKLAVDLDVSNTELSCMLQFARAYPILPHAEQLSWSDYRELLSVNAPEERNSLAERAGKEHWSRVRLREEIRNVTKGGKAAPAEVLTAEPGIPGTYRVLKATVGEHKGELVLDLGFSCYASLSSIMSSPNRRFSSPPKALIGGPDPRLLLSGRDPGDTFREGDIVMLENGKLETSQLGVEALYTYRVDVVEVIDGDTLKVSIPLGFGFTIVQKLRLRGLDAPEIESAEGKEAKAFLEKMLKSTEAEKQEKSLPLASGLSVSPVLIRTTKSDKYDRYLADVFIDRRPQTEDRSQSEVSSPQSDFVYVNQALLDEGLAVRVSE